MDFGEFRELLTGLDVQTTAEEAIDATLDRMAARNREQLRQGYTSTGKRLRPYRQYTYAQYKNLLNPLPGLWNPDFILTGAFTERIEAERVGDTIGVHSYDPKAPDLELRDSPDEIYGLGEEQHNLYVEEDLQPSFMEGIYRAFKVAA